MNLGRIFVQIQSFAKFLRYTSDFFDKGKSAFGATKKTAGPPPLRFYLILLFEKQGPTNHIVILSFY